MRRALLAIGLAALFGGADQYLGSLAGHPSATAASLLSAPWLLVAFLAGWSQPTPRRAMLLGVLCTIAALGGYWLMTLSPLEGAHLSMRAMRGLISSQSVLIVGAFVTGPLFGWLGNLGAATAGVLVLSHSLLLFASSRLRTRPSVARSVRRASGEARLPSAY